MKQITTYINEKLRLTAKRQYTCQPEDTDELRKIIIQRIKDEGLECDLNDIDVSKITSMAYLFSARDYVIFKNFNGDVSQWDVSNVKDMYAMFDGCIKFNCDISGWNVSNAKDISVMFTDCKNFNCDLSKWDVSNVEYMRYMFSNCEKFNQDLDSWNASNVKEMRYAFYKCPTQPTWYDKYKCETTL
jgi:surface protein